MLARDARAVGWGHIYRARSHKINAELGIP
jgi:hypothetical protein